MRVVQGAVGWARDDMVKFTGRNSRPFDSSSGKNSPPGQWPSSANQGSTSPEQNTQSETEKRSPSSKSLPTAASAVKFYSAHEIWERVCGLTRIAFEAALREAATLFRRRNGAPPPAPRFAVLMILALVLWSRRRRRHALPSPQSPPPSSPSTPPPSREAAAPATPHRRLAARSPAPPRNESGQGAPTPMSAAAAGLASPSRSLFAGSWALGSSTAPPVPGSPVRGPRGPLEGLDGLDPSLPSPAVARAGQARIGRARVSETQPWMGGGMRGWRGIRERARRVWGRVGGVVVAPGQWWWRWVRSRVWCREKPSGSGRRCWVWLVLLWLVASVLEVIASISVLDVYRVLFRTILIAWWLFTLLVSVVCAMPFCDRKSRDMVSVEFRRGVLTRGRGYP